MERIPLSQVDWYTANQIADRNRYETCNLINIHIDALNASEGQLGFTASNLLLPEGQFFMLLVDSSQDALLAFAQVLNMTPTDVYVWLTQFLDENVESMVELSQVENPLPDTEQDETRELDTTLFQEDTQTDRDETPENRDYLDDDLMDSDEP